MSAFTESIKNYGIQNYGVLMFTPEIALEVVNEAEKSGVKILGVDAFTLKLNFTQPWMEHGINLEKRNDGGWEVAKQHILSKKHLGLFFELCMDDGTLS